MELELDLHEGAVPGNKISSFSLHLYSGAVLCVSSYIHVCVTLTPQAIDQMCLDLSPSTCAEIYTVFAGECA